MKNKLDLHGIKHADVEILVEDFVLTNNKPMQIITGNSETMRKKTISILENHNFKWMIMTQNLGEIIVIG